MILCVLTRVCNFDLYCPVRAVHTGPPSYRYADRLLPGGTAKNRPSTVDFGRRRSIEKAIDRRRSIEEEKEKEEEEEKKKKEEEKKEYRAVLARTPSLPAGRSRAVAAFRLRTRGERSRR
ncbi:hypothetical protein BHE74_00037667, partial [Ensete ventricosum]